MIHLALVIKSTGITTTVSNDNRQSQLHRRCRYYTTCSRRCNGCKVADDAIDSEHIADGAIDTAHIVEDQ